MTLVAMPNTPRLSEVQWKLKQPTQANRSEFTGQRRIVILPMAPRWSAQVTVVRIGGEEGVLPWRAFLARLQGRSGSFRLVACEAVQFALAMTVLVDGAGQTGSTLATKGWYPHTAILAGQFVTVADQLLQIVESVTAGADGKASLSLMPNLRHATTADAPVEVHRPYALMSMAEDEAGWTACPDQQYSISFPCEESF